MTIDQQLRFLHDEITALRARKEPWTQDKLRKLEAVAESVRRLRQQEVMTSQTTGKRID